MDTVLLDLGAAPTPIFLIPAQDILTLLQNQPWSFRHLEAKELELLSEAEQFLESVKKGQSIIRESVEHGSFEVDTIALDAYEYTRRALESTLPSEYGSFEDREQFIDRVYFSIDTILSANETDKSTIQRNLAQEPRRFFEAFINYSYGKSIDISHI